jgi:tetratricopeptide (TPR) repeat protein
MCNRLVRWRQWLALTAVALLAITALACSSASSTAQSLNHQANLAYQSGDYGGALQQYRQAEVERPDLPAISYNAGNALNQQRDFQNAITEEKRATSSSDSDLQDRAFYSIGNADVRLNQLSQAVDAYKSALRANSSDLDAKYNLEVVERRLAQDQARQQAVAKQQSQPLPTKTSTPTPPAVQAASKPGGPGTPPAGGAQQGAVSTGTPPAGQVGAPARAGQQGQPAQAGGAPQGQTGQPGQGQSGQPGQAVPPTSTGQPPIGPQPQATASAQPATSASNSPGQSGASSTGGASGSASGYTGTTGSQANALDPAIRNALSQFDQSQSIDNALRALDLIAQQERIRQAARDGGTQSQGRDW